MLSSKQNCLPGHRKSNNAAFCPTRLLCSVINLHGSLHHKPLANQRRRTSQPLRNYFGHVCQSVRETKMAHRHTLDTHASSIRSRACAPHRPVANNRLRDQEMTRTLILSRSQITLTIGLPGDTSKKYVTTCCQHSERKGFANVNHANFGVAPIEQITG